MAETTFGIAYDGPALANGRMPVRELAPALIALGDLFALASDTLHPEWKPVALNVEATEQGSFFVRLILEGEDAWGQFVHMFSSADVSALANLKEVVIGSGVGLFMLIKKLRGRTVTGREVMPDPGMIRLVLDNETTIEVPADVWTLYRSVEIRKNARQVVEPLEQRGIDVVKFTTGDDEDDASLVIEKDDLPAYEIPEGRDEPLLDTENEMWVEIASVAFRSGNKWRVSAGDYTFWATMDDDRFLDRVDRGQEVFRKGDVLRCRMEVVQVRRVDGLHTEYTVLEVLEHRGRATQLAIDDDID